MFLYQNEGQLLSVIWITLYTQLNSVNTAEVVAEFMNIAWDNIVRKTVEGLKKYRIIFSPFSLLFHCEVSHNTDYRKHNSVTIL
jgi:hypothetical protein